MLKHHRTPHHPALAALLRCADCETMGFSNVFVHDQSRLPAEARKLLINRGIDVSSASDQDDPVDPVG